MTVRVVVFLVRHGRTALNADGRLRGRLDPPLDDVGLEEADAVGSVFANDDIGAVVSSPLARAMQTAAAIAAARGLAVEVDDRLADRDYGSWAGERLDSVIRQFGSVDAAPGVEPFESLSARATAAVVELAWRSTDRAGVIVAHDAVNRAIISRLVPALGGPDAISQRTGCWNRLELIDERWAAPIVGALPGELHS